MAEYANITATVLFPLPPFPHTEIFNPIAGSILIVDFQHQWRFSAVVSKAFSIKHATSHYA